MAGRYHQRPENAIAKADEFIKVGKTSRALDTLYDVFKSKKRYHTYSEKLIEQIMFKYLELCVDLRKSRIAKEGLFQYRNMCQLTNVASLASVVQGYLNLAEQRTEAARQESVESAAEVDDLDNLNTPEMIMLSAVSGEDAQDRSDRKILMPWVKFLWESYCQCLELLRTNIRVERLYHDIAQQAFRFCLKYQRKTEFRKLCDKLRNHLDLVQKQTPSQMSINLNNADTQQMNLDTRLAQLDAAIQMELWQEAYKAVEDIHGLMAMSKKTFQPKMMANYYQKLALVFWKSGNQLFHAAAIFKHFQLTREMKKNISAEEQAKLASRVLAAILAVPIPSHHPEFDRFIETDKTPQEKMVRLAVLLSLQQPPTRQSLLKDAVRFGVVSAATAPLQDLHRWLEVEFHPLKVCTRVQETLKVIEESDEKTMLAQYMGSLREITLVRLLKQVSQVYQSICFNKLLSLAPFTNSFELERTIVDCVRHNDMQVRVDHRTRTVHFGSNVSDVSTHEVEGPHLQDMPSEQVRTQLMQMLEVLDKSIKTIHPDKMKIENANLRQKIVEAFQQSKNRDRQRILERAARIEKIKQDMEEKTNAKTEAETKKAQQEEEARRREEEQRLKDARVTQEKEREEARIRDIKAKQDRARIEQIASTKMGAEILKGKTEEELATMNNDDLIGLQVQEMEREKKELEARMKAQHKRIDHLERAKRQEEIPILEESMKKDLEEDKALWSTKEADRIKQAAEDREEAVQNRNRLARMKKDKEDFMSTLLKQRKDIYEKKLKEYNTMIDKQRDIRLEERKRQRAEDRRDKWYREKEEYEQRLRDEAAKRERERKEKEEAERRAAEREREMAERERLNAIEEKKRLREKEIEEREAREREEARKAQESRGKDRDREEGGGGGWRRGGGNEREERRSPERGGGGGSWRPAGKPEGGGGWRDRVRQKDEEWGPRGSGGGRDRRDDDGPRRRDDDGPRRRDDDGPRRRDDDGPRRDADEGPWRRDGPRREEGGPRRRDDDGPPRRGPRDEDDSGGSWRQAPRREEPARDQPREQSDGFRRGGGDRDRDGNRGPPPRRFENEGRADGESSWRRSGGGVRDEPRRDDRRDDRRGPPDRRSDDRPRGGGFDREERGGGGGGGSSWRDRASGGGERGPPRRDDRRDDRGPRGGDGGGSWRRSEEAPAPRRDDRKPKPADNDGWETVSKR